MYPAYPVPRAFRPREDIPLFREGKEAERTMKTERIMNKSDCFGCNRNSTVRIGSLWMVDPIESKPSYQSAFLAIFVRFSHRKYWGL